MNDVNKQQKRRGVANGTFQQTHSIEMSIPISAVTNAFERCLKPFLAAVTKRSGSFLLVCLCDELLADDFLAKRTAGD